MKMDNKEQIVIDSNTEAKRIGPCLTITNNTTPFFSTTKNRTNNLFIVIPKYVYL